MSSMKSSVTGLQTNVGIVNVVLLVFLEMHHFIIIVADLECKSDFQLAASAFLHSFVP